MKRVLRRIVGVIVLGGLAALGVWAFIEGRSEQEREREREKPVKPPSRVKKGEGGAPVVKIDDKTRDLIGLKVEALRAAQHRQETVAYGRVEADPSRVTVLRAPIAGVLRASKEAAWPRIGDSVGDGASLGSIEPRISPVERADLDARVLDWKTRAAEARSSEADARAKAKSAAADRQGAEASLSAAKSSLERLKSLQGPDNNVSVKAVQEAEAKAQSEEARVASLRAVEEGETAREKEAASVREILDEAAKTTPLPDHPWPLTLSAGGEVVEVLAQPGEIVDAAQPLLRVARFDEVLLKATLALGDHLPEGAAKARVFVLGREDAPIVGTVVGRAPDSASQGGEVALIRVGGAGALLRPGQAATVRIEGAGGPEAGVEVPRAAVVRFMGSAWAYVEKEEGEFVRRPLVLDRPTQEGWFVASGFAAGEKIVTIGGATLLSEEQKAQIQALGEGGGAEGD